MFLLGHGHALSYNRRGPREHNRADASGRADECRKSFAIPVSFSEFNSEQGILTAVTLALQASFSGTVGIENVSNAPDVANGVIAGSVTVANNDNSLEATVSPSAAGPTHDFTVFDGKVDYAGMSGATDSVSGASVDTTVTAPISALPLFTGNTDIFLTLTASTFPIAEGEETESVAETANANATVQLTYAYTPIPEPGTLALLTIGSVAFLWLRRHSRPSRLRGNPGY